MCFHLITSLCHQLPERGYREDVLKSPSLTSLEIYFFCIRLSSATLVKAPILFCWDDFQTGASDLSLIHPQSGQHKLGKPFLCFKPLTSHCLLGKLQVLGILEKQEASRPAATRLPSLISWASYQAGFQPPQRGIGPREADSPVTKSSTLYSLHTEIKTSS